MKFGGTELDQAIEPISVRKNTDSRLYEALASGRVVGNLAYETISDRTWLTHSFVDPEYRHHGVASELARFALEDLLGEGAKAGVYCSFVIDFVRENPDWSSRLDIQYSSFVSRRMSPSDHATGNDGTGNDGE